MTHSIPIIEVRNKLTALPEALARGREPGVVAVTRRGKPVLALMPWEFYESIMETMEILGDKKLMVALRQAIRELAAGKGIPSEKAKRMLASRCSGNWPATEACEPSDSDTGSSTGWNDRGFWF